MRAALAEILRQLRDSVVSSHRITVLIKDLDSISKPRKSSGLELLPLDRAQLPGLSELNRKRGRRSVDKRFADNLERGLHGFVGLRDGATVAYYWWIECDRAGAHPDLEWLARALEVEPGDIYGSDFYVLPEDRAGGTANEFLFQLETAIAAAGFKRIWGYVDSGNREARWLYSSRGYQPTRDVTKHKFLSRTRVTWHDPE